MQPLQGPFNQPSYSAAFKVEMSGMTARFNPHDKSIVAMCCAENFGIVGKGRLFALRLENNGKVTVLNQVDEADAIFDCTWNEEDQNLLAYGTGQGFVKLIDSTNNKIVTFIPVTKGEIYSVEFSHKFTSLCLATAIDGTVSVIDFKKATIVGDMRKHEGCCYSAVWHPTNENIFGSCAADGLLKLWDLRGSGPPVRLHAHNAEILSVDFNKYEEQVVTASIDKSIKLWDLRNLKQPLNVLLGHRYAVRKAKFSPHEGNILVSASYDMNINVWDINEPLKPHKISHSEHTEFAVSVDFNLYNKRQIASCGWDGRMLVWNWDQKQPKI